MPRKEMTGMKFNRLTVVSEAGRSSCGQIMWNCVCDCGKKCIVNGCSLRNGGIKSCGCVSRRDITGMRSGKLTALRPATEDEITASKGYLYATNKHPTYWVCECECGRTSLIQSASIVSGNSKSCGLCSFGRYDFYDSFVTGTFENDESFVIDTGDYKMISAHRWWRDKGSGYFATNIDGRIVYLHTILLPPRDGMVADHINRNKDDNRRCNLRYCTPQQNSFNKSKLSTNTSGYIGVCYHIVNKVYTASIKVNGKTQNLGNFASKEEAARVRDSAAQEYFGEFAVLNFPEESGL